MWLLDVALGLNVNEHFTVGLPPDHEEAARTGKMPRRRRESDLSIGTDSTTSDAGFSHASLGLSMTEASGSPSAASKRRSSASGKHLSDILGSIDTGRKASGPRMSGASESKEGVALALAGFLGSRPGSASQPGTVAASGAVARMKQRREATEAHKRGIRHFPNGEQMLVYKSDGYGGGVCRQDDSWLFTTPLCVSRYRAFGVFQFVPGSVYDRLVVGGAAASHAINVAFHVIAIAVCFASGLPLLAGLCVATLVAGVGATAWSLYHHGRSDLAIWHLLALAPVREAYCYLVHGYVNSRSAGVDLRLDLPMTGVRLVHHTYLLHSLWASALHALCILCYVLDAEPDAQQFTSEDTALTARALLITSATIAAASVASSIALSDRYNLYNRRAVAPNDNDSALVAICNAVKHFSSSFATITAYRVLEVGARVCMVTALVGGLGWLVTLAFVVFDMFFMIMYWTTMVRGIFAPIVLVVTSPKRMAYVLYAMLLFPGFRNTCPEWMYLIRDDERWHPMLFLLQRAFEEAGAIVVLLWFGSYNADDGDGTLTGIAGDTGGADASEATEAQAVAVPGDAGIPLLRETEQNTGLVTVQVLLVGCGSTGRWAGS